MEEVPAPEITMPNPERINQPMQRHSMIDTDETQSEVDPVERAQMIEDLKAAIENAETAEAKHELEMRLAEQQALLQPDQMEEMQATQTDVNRLQEQEEIGGAGEVKR